MVDPHKVVRNIVITCLAECARWYGVNKQTKTLEGVVVDVIIERSGPGKKGATKIVADYDLGGGVIKRASINICSIKAKEVQNVVVEAPEQNVQDAVGGIQAPEEQCEPKQLNAPDPVDTVPHMAVTDPVVVDVQLVAHLYDDPADEIPFADCHHQSGFKMMVPS
jgi:hypothetical protein